MIPRHEPLFLFSIAGRQPAYKSSRCHPFPEQFRKYGDAETFQHGSGRLAAKKRQHPHCRFSASGFFHFKLQIVFLFSRNKTPGHPDPEILSCNLSFSISSFT